MRRASGALGLALILALAPHAGALAAVLGKLAGLKPTPTPLNIAADNVSGSHEPQGDIVLLHGNVRITRGRTVITADSGRYVRAEGVLDLDSHVRMVDSTATVTCDHASYSENTDVLDLRGNVVVTDKNSTLHAPTGTYDRATGRARLTGGVTGQDGDQHLTCDNAVYLRDSSRVEARGHVHGLDDKNHITLDAQAIDYDRTRHLAVATRQPVMRATDHDGRTIEMRAVTLRVNTDTRVAEAIDSVRVVRDTLQATADHALFDDRADHGWLTGRPRVWDNETAVTGDSLEFVTDQRVLKRVVVHRNAEMNYSGIKPTAVGEASRLTGQRVDMFLTRDDIDSLVAIGDARNEYQGAPRPGETAERNLATGDTITVFFRERKIDRARVQGKANGEYHVGVAQKDTVAARKEQVKYDARRIEFVVPKSRIVLDRDAHLIYQDLELRAQRVEYDVERQTLVAQGNPQLLDRGDKVGGGMMTYDLGSRVGTIYGAETSYERGLYHGERIRKAGDNELDVMNGVYTTCDLAEPHYHFSAHWMKIYLKDKLVAKPVVFYVKNVPLFALPFWVFPIKPGRHSGFLFPQFELGFNNRAGQFLRNAGYYWAPNDYMDLTLSGDYYQAEPSWVLRADALYKLLYHFDGELLGNYAHNEAAHTTDWSFDGNHSQDITPRTRLVARGQWVSSRTYAGSDLYGNPLAERLNRFLTSSVAVTHNADWASFSGVVDMRQNIDADATLQDPDGAGPLHGPPVGTLSTLPNLVQNEPSVTMALPTRTLGGLALLHGSALERPLSTVYFSLSGQFLNYRERLGYVSGTTPVSGPLGPDSVNVVGQRVTTRRAFASAVGLSDSRRLFGWLNFAPRLIGNVVIWDYDLEGNKVVPSGTWSAGAGLSSSFYGTFRPHLGPLEGLRHIVVPSVGVTYSPEFSGLTFTDTTGVVRSRFAPFDGISISGFKVAHLDFALDQRFQAKLRQGQQLRRLDNLLTWNMSSSYNLLYREEGQLHGLSPINSAVLLQPPGVINANLGWVTDPYQSKPVRQVNYNLNLSLSSAGRVQANPDLPVDRTERGTDITPQDTWSLAAAYSYSGGYSGSDWATQKNVNFVVRSQFTPSWGIEYSSSYDLTLHELGTQRFALTRDLHCWTASFTRSFNFGGEAEYYVRFSVKEQRELYLERGTRSGSLGGIQ